MTKKQIQEMLEKHNDYLARKPCGVRADLSGVNLSGVNLRGANLRGANLSKAYLRGANLRGANLRGAILSKAYLNGAYLNRANMSGAILRGAILSGAILRGAILRGANLRGANLSGANLRGANLNRADLNNTKGVIGFYVGGHFGYMYDKNQVKIGCMEMPLKDWLKKYREIGKAQGYTKKQIQNYRVMLNALKKIKIIN